MNELNNFNQSHLYEVTAAITGSEVNSSTGVKFLYVRCLFAANDV